MSRKEYLEIAGARSFYRPDVPPVIKPTVFDSTERITCLLLKCHNAIG